ncbi:MAG: methyltransferase [Verrucomicrobiota bacterium]
MKPEKADGNFAWAQATRYVSTYSDGLPPPSLFAKAIAEALPVQSSTRLLDIGCGSGVVGLYALVSRGAQFVTFNDIQPEAIAETQRNVEWHVAEGRLRHAQVAYRVGPLESLIPELVSQHNLIAFNPPQYPCAFADEEELLQIRKKGTESVFRLGGDDGLKLVRTFLRWLGSLEPHPPKTIILLSSFLSRSRIEALFRANGFGFTRAVEIAAPLRPSLMKAAESFSPDEQADRALIKVNGQWQKQLWAFELQRLRSSPQ